MDSLLLKSLLLISLGALTIGLGGTLTTLGWKQLDARSRYRGTFTAVAQEWEINNVILKDPLFTSSDDKYLGNHRLCPRLKIFAIDHAIASGLIKITKPEGKEIFHILDDYETAILDVNSRFQVIDNFVTSTMDNIKIAERRKHLQNSKGFLEFKDLHLKFRDLLSKHSDWVFKEKLFD